MNRNVLAVALGLLVLVLLGSDSCEAAPKPLRLQWEQDFLTISGPDLPGRELKIHYLEAYCRPGSTHRKWEQTVIAHKTRLLEADADGHRLRLECTLKDGVIVDHEITATSDEVEFRITARNRTPNPSQADWAQPCIRVDAFTGRDKDHYLDKCFIFLNGKLTRMPTAHWATEALYTPGQVWCPRGVSREDVNPRPLSDDVPDNGLIGCFSADEKKMMAVAFEPYQELFQGVACCLHSDFRIGGLKPGESKQIRGKLYVVPADVSALLARYRRDFPQQAAADRPAARLAERGRIPVLAWIGPPASQTTVDRYRELAECGFTMNFTGMPDMTAVARQLDVAKEAGVQVLISCPELEKDPEGTVARFKGHPALGGYFLRDEPAAGDFAGLAKWAARIKAACPDHLVYINLFPNYATPRQLGAGSYREYVNRFVKEVPVPLISFDFYPIVGDSVRPEWYENLQTIADAARGANKPFWAFALSLRHYGYPTPTLAHLREQVFSDLACGAQGIEYFTYWQPEGLGDDAPINAAGKRTGVYDRVKQMNAEIRSLSPVFLGAKVVSIGHTGKSLPAGTRGYQPAAPVKELRTGDAGAIVSLLANGPRRFLVVVNRDIAHPLDVSASFDGSKTISRVTKDGTLEPLTDQTLRAALEPGDALILSWPQS